MGDVLSPFIIASPPPPSSPSTKNNSMPMLYYGLTVVATAAIVLAIYNLVLLRRDHVGWSRNTGPTEDRGLISRRTESGQHMNLLSSFKYKKEVVLQEEEHEEKVHDDDLECSVCLSVYEEGEEVRKLPECKHCFHVICIDMWLYSHLDCPICRTPVILFPVENSSHGIIMESGATMSL